MLRFSGFLFILIFISVEILNAFQVEISCASDGTMISSHNSVGTIDIATTCKTNQIITQIANLNSGSTNCAKNSTQNVEIGRNKRQILLVSEMNSRASNRSSVRYDREQIKKIVDISVKNGVDPYLAVALVIMENPPLLAKNSELISEREIYKSLFGDIPLDERAYAGVFNCSVASSVEGLGEKQKTTSAEIKEFQSFFKTERTKYLQTISLESKLKSLKKRSGAQREITLIEDQISAIRSTNPEPARLAEIRSQDREKYNQIYCYANPNCHGFLFQNPKQVRVIDLATPNQPKSQAQACLGNSPLVGGAPPRVEISTSLARSDSQSCCMQIVVDKVAFENGSVRELFQSYMGTQFIKQAIQNSSSRTPANFTGSEKIAWMIQGFNGRGKTGKSEVNKSSCLEGIDMNKNPVAGATAADVMMNMLMSNPEINQMVEESLLVNKKSQISIHCLASGQGTHKLDSAEFVKLQEKYLTIDSNGALDEKRKANCTKGKLPITFGPWKSLKEPLELLK